MRGGLGYPWHCGFRPGQVPRPKLQAQHQPVALPPKSTSSFLDVYSCPSPWQTADHTHNYNLEPLLHRIRGSRMLDWYFWSLSDQQEMEGVHKAFIDHPGNPSLNRDSRGLREAGGAGPMWTEVLRLLKPHHTSLSAGPLQGTDHTTTKKPLPSVVSVQVGLTPR